MFALSVLHNWKEAIDKKYLGALLTKLLKEIDCISNDLLIVKLNGYILSLSTLKLINVLKHYRVNQKQSIEFDSFYSSWKDILAGVP